MDCPLKKHGRNVDRCPLWRVVFSGGSTVFPGGCTSL